MRAIKLYFSAFVVLFAAQSLLGQSYNGVVGLRANGDLGISAAAQILKRQTLQFEHQSGLFSPIHQTSLMYKKHYPVLTRRFNVSMGGGAILRGEDLAGERPMIQSTPALGLTFGGEFTVGRVNITYDFMPGMFLGDVDGAQFFSNSGVGVRYVLFERESATKKTLRKVAFWNRDKKDNKKKPSKNDKEKKKFLIF
jgi:hypothetical protein